MRTITVKGGGEAGVKPDCIRISIELSAKDADYSMTLELISMHNEELIAALRSVKILPDQVKTTDFNIQPQYENVQDSCGNWKQAQKGYCCLHRMYVELDLDLEALARVLSVVSGCDACPVCRIRFTLRDPRAAEELLLRDAAANARERAEILANASGCELGELQNIDYQLGSLHADSATNFDTPAEMLRTSKLPSFTPNDIHLSQDVAFTWELL